MRAHAGVHGGRADPAGHAVPWHADPSASAVARNAKVGLAPLAPSAAVAQLPAFASWVQPVRFWKALQAVHVPAEEWRQNHWTLAACCGVGTAKAAAGTEAV
mmetsp:Transcript_3223/g.5753  ORF Transcript_3223/g.5753 Transcript_3223/m.5753 type:complete len:102 (+) Transcript_3223:710-1015(+)